jgi:predicted RNase H-like HicB family nuclease
MLYPGTGAPFGMDGAMPVPQGATHFIQQCRGHKSHPIFKEARNLNTGYCKEYFNITFEERQRENGGGMKNTYTAIVKQDAGWWIGWIQEIPGVNCQERTKEELVESLRVTLHEALELNREEALKAANSEYTEIPVIP